MPESLAAVLLDVDGTLIDTSYLHAVTWWQAFARTGHDVPMRDIHRAIGMGSDQLLDHLLPGHRDRGEDEVIATSHDALFSTYWSRLRPLPGAASLVRACKQRGRQVVLASSAGRKELEIMRSALGADDAIDAVTSSGDVRRSKPAPDIVRVALEKAAVSAAEAVFVGDTVWDVRACQKSGVRCIAVLTGGVGRDELLTAGADAVYDSPQDLLDHIAETTLGQC